MLPLRSMVLIALLSCSMLSSQPSKLIAAEPLRVVFLGDRGHHRPADLAGRIVPALAAYGIEMEYTEDINVLSPERLKSFDGLFVYANIDTMTPEQEAALLSFVEEGKGFIPVHCATFCFRNSNAYVELCGAQFQNHGGEEFATKIVAPDHPIMKGFEGFYSWDETYVHSRHNEVNRTVLEVREQGVQARGRSAEPWTWVRTHGKGRVFYTAWGHDHRTWNQPGFHNLLARGILWACGRDPSVIPSFRDPALFPVPKMTAFRTDVAPFTYTDVGAKIPNYVPSNRWGVQGDPLTKMQNPLPPEESVKHYITPEDFDIQLWASEPDLAGKPIAMNWDERGRLWVCETVDYPNELQPRGRGRDRIRICEDTNGDGRADTFKVFADGLSIPTTLVIYRGGAIVQDGAETVYLKDMDGDDRADFRQVLITGWAINDTHGGVSNFQYGPDNWIWAMQGYNDSHPVINGERQQGFRQGFWRFRVEAGPSDATAPVTAIDGKIIDPDNMNRHTIRVRELEFVRATNNNTWGLGISEEGLIFGSTANGNPSNFMPIPNRYYERVKGWAPTTLEMISDTFKFAPATDKVRQVDFHGGYTAGAGHAIYTARQYPSAWWNRTAFVCEPTGHLIGTFILKPDGADYRSKSPFNLLASDDEWASPIMAEVGPDGNVWVIDWYNYIVQHNPTPHGFSTGRGNAFESDLRDKKHGRIYRVIYRGDGASPSSIDHTIETDLRQALQSGSHEPLVRALKHSTMQVRLHAQRMLVERGPSPEVVTELVTLLRDRSVDAIGLNPGVMHALWTLAGLNQVQPNQLEVWNAVLGCLEHPSAGVRRAAATSMPNDAATSAAIIERGLVFDSDAQVRLAALLKLSDVPSDGPVESDTLARVTEIVGDDRWLLDGWTSAASGRTSSTIAKLLERGGKLPSNVLRQVAFLAEHAARSKMDAARVKQVLAVMSDSNPELTRIVIDGWVRGWPGDHAVTLDEEAGEMLVALLEKLPVESQSSLVQISSKLGAKSLEGQLRKIVQHLRTMFNSAEQSPEQRIRAAQQAVAMLPNDEKLVDELLECIQPQTPPQVSSGFLSALINSRATNVASSALERFGTMSPDGQSEVIRVLMARPETTVQLLEAINEGALRLSDLRLDQRQALRDHPDANIRELASNIMAKGGGAPSSNREQVIEEWMEVTRLAGSASEGKELYKKHCALCHQHQGEGVNIGPDLSGMAVHPKAELLVHILDPNRSVEGNFRTYTVLTTDGLVKTGMLVGESRTSIELVDTQGKRETILREDIESLKASTKSLMPEGFEDQMTKNDMRDILEFLTSRGKYIPLPLGKVATAISSKGLFHDGDDGPDRMIFPDWSPKTFEGIPFVLVDPQEKRTANIILLHGPMGTLPPKMPKSVSIPCAAPAAAIHFLSGVSGYGFPFHSEKSVSMIVRLHYADGQTEDHELLNGEHFADYIRRVDVPKSKFAFSLRGQQIRYFSVVPTRAESLKEIELVKGDDISAPIVMAMTLESP